MGEFNYNKNMYEEKELESYFHWFRVNTIGSNHRIDTPYGNMPLIYADWIASGRLYAPIERRMINEIGPMIGNTHSESSETGRIMTEAYHYAHSIIKKHVNAGADDMIVTAGTGMTGVVNKLQRILGLRLPPKGILDLSHGLPEQRTAPADNRDKPVVFLTHMEHHSNHVSWLETICDVIVIPPGRDLLVDTSHLEELLETYKERSIKIGSFSAASNVTGIIPPYRELARIMHRNGGIAFIDFAASAPYVDIDMHPEKDPEGAFDGIFLSPHKFLGGPGSAGVMVFNRKLYKNLIPDNPGGGTVNWTNRWGQRSYVTDIEAREDGGTPGFLQTIRAALAMELKNQMNTEKIYNREKQLYNKAYSALSEISGIHILGIPPQGPADRIGVISFYAEKIHHNLMVRMLNDLYGVQVRGGCSCAGTYGHYLLNVPKTASAKISKLIDSGDLSEKPGWVRLSLHPTMTDEELDIALDGIRFIAEKGPELADDYQFSSRTGEFHHIKDRKGISGSVIEWFTL